MSPQDEMIRVTLFAMVMDMCQQLGMTEKEAASMFSKSHIKGGYAILNERPANAPP